MLLFPQCFDLYVLLGIAWRYFHVFFFHISFWAFFSLSPVVVHFIFLCYCCWGACALLLVSLLMDADWMSVRVHVSREPRMHHPIIMSLLTQTKVFLVAVGCFFLLLHSFTRCDYYYYVVYLQLWLITALMVHRTKTTFFISHFFFQLKYIRACGDFSPFWLAFSHSLVRIGPGRDVQYNVLN